MKTMLRIDQISLLIITFCLITFAKSAVVLHVECLKNPRYCDSCRSSDYVIYAMSTTEVRSMTINFTGIEQSSIKKYFCKDTLDLKIYSKNTAKLYEFRKKPASALDHSGDQFRYQFLLNDINIDDLHDQGTIELSSFKENPTDLLPNFLTHATVGSRALVRNLQKANQNRNKIPGVRDSSMEKPLNLVKNPFAYV